MALLREHVAAGAHHHDALLFPRPSVSLLPCPGALEALAQGTSLFPVAMAPGMQGPLVAMASGRRGALWELEGVLYKLKGIAIDPARPILTKAHPGSATPRGGQALGRVRSEMARTHAYNSLMQEEGFATFQQPEAIFIYPTTFMPDYHELAASALRALSPLAHGGLREGLWGLFYNLTLHVPERLAASAMRVKGDTRLPELLRAPVRDMAAAEDVCERIGLAAGAQKRITERAFTWHVNDAHIGNYALFTEGGQLHAGMCDFEWAAPGRWLTRIRSRYERTRILATASSSGEELVEGTGQRGTTPLALAQRFREGFGRGYRSPGLREAIPLAHVHEAYALPGWHARRGES